MTSHDAFEFALDRRQTMPSDFVRGDMVRSPRHRFQAERCDFVLACVTVSIACLAGLAGLIA